MGDVAAVDVKIIVSGDAKASATALAVQQAVKEDVQNMTGIAVAQVNVYINGVKYE